MVKKGAILLGLFGMILFFNGCTSSRLANDYGTSHRVVIAEQTLNPEAEKNLEPVYGLDGQAAYKVITRYRKSFEKAEPPPFYTTGLSTIAVMSR